MRISFFVPYVNVTIRMHFNYEYANRLIEKGHKAILYKIK